MQPITTEQDLDNLGRSAYAYATITAWAGAGLFAWLDEQGPQPAAAFPIAARSVENTAPLLAHVGLLDRRDDRWGLSERGAALLAAGSLRYTGAEANLGGLARLDEVLRSGEPVRATDGGVVEQDVERAREFMAMLYRRSAASAVATAEALRGRLDAGAHLLDVGGGHGRYAGEAVDRGLRATLVDRAVCVQVARERFADRLDYLVADFMADDLGGPYDGALLSNIVHGLGPDEVGALFARLAAALRPGGLVVVKDMLLDDSGANPEQAASFAITMLLYTRHGRSYRADELLALGAPAGLAAAGVEPLANAPGHSLLWLRRV